MQSNTTPAPLFLDRKRNDGPPGSGRLLPRILILLGLIALCLLQQKAQNLAEQAARIGSPAQIEH